ncbi:DAK2 domain-containing protein [Streptomyces mobaraensis NBRC 13819 = DSM 40847]|uniref:Dihydroxyacetone kinase n=1 Tax=Streptomyces mobaraensis (strain ATCC 29032 / DSM 40847 / JCM 4168 / NBRC 13819 / NCIMB 11159 / IPCR 16-22) TaxID=1223523 RepID=M3B3N3_STRM1|nr:dihydroxyacetone kinase [Streptomyces mobaraensis NBRC 13819 = DSM 40847]QTT75934.1 DAK2 domain-containing protein [Streptomyces mobaraensis NBRC 13819 = DSM 40847]
MTGPYPARPARWSGPHDYCAHGSPPTATHPEEDPQVPHPLDAAAVRAWCALALDALGRAREEIDAINVYPVADGDTGTNLYLTAESAVRAVEAVFEAHATAGPGARPGLSEAVRAMAHGALIGARGNSGTILAQLFRGMAEVLKDSGGSDQGHLLGRALRRAVDSAYEGVARPVEGTVLTVAAAAADAAARTEGDAAAVARAAHTAARTALEATPGQLAALGRAGVVDAGGKGLVEVLGALVAALEGGATPDARPARISAPRPADGCPAGGAHGAAPGTGPAFEVIYLLEADDAAVARLRARLDALGESLVVVGGDGLWNVHVHVDDAGAAVEAGVDAGRPYRIRITHFGAAADERTRAPEPAQRAVVAVVPGEGLAALCAEAGATVVPVRPGEPPASGELVEAVRRAHAREVVLLPNDPDLRHTAAAAAEQARAEGVRVALIPTRSPVQGVAALAVHEPGRRFDEDVVAMTSAAGATRYAELTVAESRSWTMAGVCQAGDVLGLIDGDVAVIGADLAATAATVLDRMLAAGGELVTLVVADDAPAGFAEGLERHVRGGHLAVDTVVYRGGRQPAPLLIGVE